MFLSLKYIHFHFHDFYHRTESCSNCVKIVIDMLVNILYRWILKYLYVYSTSITKYLLYDVTKPLFTKKN